ncbi:MAG: histidine kinase dimerization/phospho-acceptor domain-containing protein [Pseudomonadota bacterium]
MKLRTQLLLAAAVLLLLPWLGYEYILELDASLREQQSRALRIQAQAAAAIVQANRPTNDAEDGESTSGAVIYAHRVADTSTIILDGYIDDWPPGLGPPQRIFFGDNKLKPVQSSGRDVAVVESLAMRRSDMLYLFLKVSDGTIIYHNAQSEELASGDRIVLRSVTDGENPSLRDFVFSAIAPGAVTAQYKGKRKDGITPFLQEERMQAYWEDTTEGYHIELQIPLPTGDTRFGFAIGDVDVDDDPEATPDWTGTFDPRDKSNVGTLHYTNDILHNALAQVAPSCGNIRFFDHQGWLQADTSGTCPEGQGEPLEAKGLLDAVLFRVFEQLIDYPYVLEAAVVADNGRVDPGILRGESGRVWHTQIDRVNQLVAIQNVVTDGAADGFVLVDQESDTVRVLSTQALVKLFSITVLSAVLVSLAMLIYAGILSWRIRRLRDHTHRALTDSGEIVTPPASRARDEVGDLSRDLHAMLTRVQAHNDYQGALAARLTHELRTPLSVVRTSVEALSESAERDSQEALIERARSGSDQLALILQSLTESSRLEEIIGDVEFESIDLCEFVSVAVDAYGAVYPERNIESETPDEPTWILGNGELLRQLTDKLVANAIEFGDVDSPVILAVVVERKTVTLSVVNTGSQLPEDGLDIYSPMTSIRELSDTGEAADHDQPHLGMGLFVAKLIADKHDAVISAHDLDYMHGVQVSVRFELQKG